MQTATLFTVLTIFSADVDVNGDKHDSLSGVWKPTEVWVEGERRKPDRSHFKLYVNERKQWALGDWPDYPDLSDARLTDEKFRPRGAALGTPVLPEPFQIWTSIDDELNILIRSSLRSDSSMEQRTIKKYAIRDDKLYVFLVSSTWQPAKHWWGWAERHGDLGGGFYVGKFPSAGPKELPKSDRASLGELKVPATPAETAKVTLDNSMPKLESAGQQVVPRPEMAVVVYEREIAGAPPDENRGL